MPATGSFLSDPGFAPIARDNLAGRVYEELRTALMEGRLWPGQRLKIRELAAALHVSETPVREAVMQLVRERGLEMQANRAITVAHLSLAQYEELRRIRLELEGLAAAEAAPRSTRAVVEELEALHADLLAAQAAEDWPDAVRANWRFHHRVYRTAAMPELLGIIETLWLRNGPLLNYQYPHAPPTYPGRHRHLDVIDAMRARDPAAVRTAIRNDTVEGGATLLRLLTDIEAGRVVIGQPHFTAPPPFAPS
ncbi:MAG: GntR family transcriptional regulator [Rhodospirillales bacterium 69-11]|nr:GntR family transcriptional regulator [Rhodospirillales bacterium]OJW28295.1 MAG: GntR family transcriptional regulator [Rhodospirillales bacterium 69-11]